MRMRVEFTVEEDTDIADVMNGALEALDAVDANWYRLDELPAAEEEEGRVLSPGNSAYVEAEGGEVNNPTTSALAQDEEAVEEARLAEEAASIEAEAEADEPPAATNTGFDLGTMTSPEPTTTKPPLPPGLTQ